MSDQRVPTVRIKHAAHPEGIVINESDFDDAVHELHGVEAQRKLSIGEMRALLTERGIAYPDGAKKADLQGLLG